MHIPTHMLAGWVVGNAFGLGKRERSLAILAGMLHDVDGLGIIVSEELYWDWHHKLGHNLFFCVALAGLLTIFSRQRMRSFTAYTVIAGSHLLLDFLGSGPNWTLAWLWPVSGHELEFAYAWPFFSWQNLGSAGLLIVATVWTAWRHDRTPVEWITPDLDRRLVAGLRRRSKAGRPV
ncbi:MAG: metal-dependent hydrolase [Planctomycetota bacterium]